MGIHPSHKTRFSDASTFDEICTLCGATDEIGGFGNLQYPCNPRVKPTDVKQTEEGHNRNL